jgi:tRNA threonylcarbamoyl adenosine modification protein YjeE
LDLARELAHELRAGDRVLLEGGLGAGKTTFARALLENLGVSQPPEGSPTFAIAHEYARKDLRVIHVDLYRLRSEGEIDEAGIPTYFWPESHEPQLAPIVICEWLSMWPAFESAVLARGRNWRVQLGFEENATLRHVAVTRLGLS